MSDNVTLNAGTGGATLAADEIAAVHHQLVKLEYGDDGSATQVSDTNPLPIDDAGGSITVDGTVAVSAVSGTVAVSAASLPLPSGAATAAKQPALGTAGTASSDVLTVQGIASMTALKVDGSAVTQPVSIAASVAVTDNNSTLSIDDGAGSITVDGTVAVSGSVAVTDNGGNLSIDDGGNSITVDSAQLPAALAANGGLKIEGVAGGVVVPVADGGGSLTVDGTVTVQDGGGSVSIDDNGGSLTVDGTVAVSGTVAVTDNSGSLTVDGSVSLTPTTSGGHSISRTISAASTNATNVKGSAGQLYGYIVSNVNAAARYLKFYNKATAPTIGTDTPVLTVCIPGNTAGVTGHVEFANGIAFSAGIGFGLTTGVADSDTGAVAANEQVVNLFYK
jgi:hypothetical protein